MRCPLEKEIPKRIDSKIMHQYAGIMLRHYEAMMKTLSMGRQKRRRIEKKVNPVAWT